LLEKENLDIVVRSWRNQSRQAANKPRGVAGVKEGIIIDWKASDK